MVYRKPERAPETQSPKDPRHESIGSRWPSPAGPMAPISSASSRDSKGGVIDSGTEGDCFKTTASPGLQKAKEVQVLAARGGLLSACGVALILQKRSTWIPT